MGADLAADHSVELLVYPVAARRPRLWLELERGYDQTPPFHDRLYALALLSGHGETIPDKTVGRRANLEI